MEDKKKKTPPTEVLDDDFDDLEDDDEEEEEEEGLEDEDIEDEDEVDEEDIEDEDDDDEEEEEGNENRDDGKDKKPEKKVQSKEERAKYAQMRREREAREREAREKRIRDEAYLKGKLDTAKVNTFTDEPINDEYDLKVYEAQLALEAEGKDPTRDLPKYMAELSRKEAKLAKDKEEEKKKEEEQIDKELSEFRQKYPKIKASELLKDPDFADYADGRIGKGGKTLVQLYENFEALKSKFGGKEKGKEEEDDGKRTPPSPIKGRKTETTSFSKLSKEEREKELRRQGLIN